MPGKASICACFTFEKLYFLRCSWPLRRGIDLITWK
jgi:hypothetical protein